MEMGKGGFLYFAFLLFSIYSAGGLLVARIEVSTHGFCTDRWTPAKTVDNSNGNTLL